MSHAAAFRLGDNYPFRDLLLRGLATTSPVAQPDQPRVHLIEAGRGTGGESGSRRGGGVPWMRSCREKRSPFHPIPPAMPWICTSHGRYGGVT